MSRLLILALLTVVFAVPHSQAIAQGEERPADKTNKRTLKYADSAPKRSQGTEVVRPAQVTELKSWLPDVSSLPAKGYPDITVIAESIKLTSKGTMRWTFAVYNKGESRNFIFNLGKCYLADDHGETYKPVAQEFPPNYGEYNRLGLLEGTKKRFWLEFKAPVQPTTTFRVGMILEGGFSTQFNAFAPFLVTLEKPLFYDNGMFQLESEVGVRKVEGEDVDGGADASPKQGINATRPGSPQRASRTTLSAAVANTFLGLSDKGLTVNGGITPKTGGNISGRMVFRKRPLDDLVEARIVSTNNNATVNIDVVGAYFEDLTTPSGLTLKMIDPAKTRYWFTLSGNNLSGEDSLGNKYRFVISTK